MPLLSDYAAKKKIDWFIRPLPRATRILEIGSGSGWLRPVLEREGYRHYTGLDIVPPAEVVGDIRQWRDLGLEAESFDAIVAFEVIEHVPCFQECFELLSPGGQLLLTSPHPNWDWLCRLLEVVGLNQQRTSPHEFLIDFHRIPLFEPIEIKRVGIMAQWGKLRKPASGQPSGA